MNLSPSDHLPTRAGRVVVRGGADGPSPTGPPFECDRPVIVQAIERRAVSRSAPEGRARSVPLRELRRQPLRGEQLDLGTREQRGIDARDGRGRRCGH